MQKAEAELAYDLQKAKLMQSIREEQIKIDIIERRKLVSICEFRSYLFDFSILLFIGFVHFFYYFSISDNR